MSSRGLTAEPQVVWDRDHIRVIDNVLTAEMCQALIEGFEANSDQHVNLPHSLQTVLAEWHWPHKDSAIRYLNQVVNDEYHRYADHWDQTRMLPNKWFTDGYRVKAYRPQQHEFVLHVDTVNKSTAQRFIAFLFYLNDSDAGTEFPTYNHRIEARQGRLVIFPPNWQYPHRGEMPQHSSKYIISIYGMYA